MVLDAGPFPCGRVSVFGVGVRLFLDKDEALAAAGDAPVVEFVQVRRGRELVPAYSYDADGSETSIIDGWHMTDKASAAAHFPDPRLRFDRYGDLTGFDGDLAAFQAFRSRVLTSGKARQDFLTAIRFVADKLAYDEECRAQTGR